MKTIITKHFPAKAFESLTVWPFLFLRKDRITSFTTKDANHEDIHGEQQKEMLLVGIVLAIVLVLSGCGWYSLLTLPIYFYWYGVEWLVRLCITRDKEKAYRGVCYEREAYAHQEDFTYPKNRRHFAWVKYLKQ